jgi:hypothetical protein
MSDWALMFFIVVLLACGLCVYIALKDGNHD